MSEFGTVLSGGALNGQLQAISATGAVVADTRIMASEDHQPGRHMVAFGTGPMVLLRFEDIAEVARLHRVLGDYLESGGWSS